MPSINNIKQKWKQKQTESVIGILINSQTHSLCIVFDFVSVFGAILPLEIVLTYIYIYRTLFKTNVVFCLGVARGIFFQHCCSSHLMLSYALTTIAYLSCPLPHIIRNCTKTNRIHTYRHKHTSWITQMH